MNTGKFPFINADPDPIGMLLIKNIVFIAFQQKKKLEVASVMLLRAFVWKISWNFETGLKNDSSLSDLTMVNKG